MNSEFRSPNFEGQPLVNIQQFSCKNNIPIFTLEQTQSRVGLKREVLVERFQRNVI